jgi:hypothetical protein
MTDALLAQALGGESDGASSGLGAWKVYAAVLSAAVVRCTGLAAGILRLRIAALRPYNPAAANTEV